MKNNIMNLSETAIAAIECLQHPSGTFEYYTETLSRLFNYILDQSDEIGMSATEALHTLRVLACLRDDLAHIGGRDETRKQVQFEGDMEGAERSLESLPQEDDPESGEYDLMTERRLV